jgi:hypothetical protein
MVQVIEDGNLELAGHREEVVVEGVGAILGGQLTGTLSGELVVMHQRGERMWCRKEVSAV